MGRSDPLTFTGCFVTDNDGGAKAKIAKGIAAYAHEQQLFIRLLRRRGSFTEREFDKWFRNREWTRPRLYPSHGICGDSFILGMGVNGGNLWAFMLDLLQHMRAIGLVKTSTVDGLVVYSLHG
jgi:hypothetical protein